MARKIAHRRDAARAVDQKINFAANRPGKVAE